MPTDDNRGEDFDDFEFSEPDICYSCDGSGERNVCIDDLCAGSDTCIHGDGLIPCGTCGGSGIV